MADTEAISFPSDPDLLSTIVVGELMETWAPTPVTIFVPLQSNPRHAAAIRSVGADYDPEIVYYDDPDRTNMVYIARTGTMPMLRAVGPAPR